MEHPEREVAGVIKSLTTGTPTEQQAALQKYFVSNAAFIHPFVWVPQFHKGTVPFFSDVDSRWVLQGIYRWYRILSPHIDISIESTAFDQKKGLLYVSISQVFRIWFIPFYSAPVDLVTVLKLEQYPLPEATTSAAKSNQAKKHRYYISSQEDHYQVNQFLQFVTPRVGPFLWTVWQLISAGFCVALSLLFLPLYYLLNRGESIKTN